MQKVLFITNIEALTISADLGRGEKVGEILFITNNKSVIEGLLTPNFMTLAGTIEVKYLINSGAVLYAIEDCEPFPTEPEALSFLNKHLIEVSYFLQMLWLIKDHAANAELGYIEYPYKYSRSSVTQNRISSSFSKASGKHLTVEFSRDELRKARELFRTHLHPEEIKLSPHTVTENVDRFSRAFYFLQAARANHDLGVKISNYCTCLEALFSSDPQELSHKLSERIAWFLETSFQGRIKVFRDIKKAYDIRSKVVHGAKGSKSLQEMIENVALSCDQIIRRVFQKMIEDQSLYHLFTSNTFQDIEDYFLKLTLGGQAS